MERPTGHEANGRKGSSSVWSRFAWGGERIVTHRLLVLIGLGVLFALACFFLIFKLWTDSYISESEMQRRANLREMVTLARNAIEPIVEDVRQGRSDRDEAIARIQALVGRMTYDDEQGKNYIFMSAYDGTMLVQPYAPELVGTNQWEMRDPDGFPIIQELVRTARNSPEGGYVTYAYLPPGSGVPELKLSYVVGIPELQCYIGTGKYLQAILGQQIALVRWAYVLAFALLLVFSTPLFLFALVLRRQNRALAAEVDERSRAENALQASESRFRAFMEHLPGLVVIKDARSRFVYFNQQFLDTFPVKDWHGRTPGELFSPEVAARMVEMDQKALRDGFVVYDEVWDAESGRVKILEMRKFAIPQDDGTYIGTIVSDVTERKISEEKYRVLFEAAKDAILIIKDGRIVECNTYASEMFGCSKEALIGANPAEFSPKTQPDGSDSGQAARELIEKAVAGRPQFFEWRHRRCSGEQFTVEVSLVSMSVHGETLCLGFIRDVTERKQMEAMMVQTEKMVSLGGIAAGIAHEINNPLGIVLQAANNVIQRLRPDFEKNVAVAAGLGLDMEKLSDYVSARKIDVFVEDIRSAAVRASGIVRHMLDFSRQSGSVRGPCDLSALIERAVTLASSDYDLKKSYDFRKIEIIRDIAPDMPHVVCAQTEIEQVVLNLLRNAAQAMASAEPAVAAPRIVIRARVSGGMARIEIEDNGPGMDQETQRRIFEPFFTTQPTGVGTGRGLSVSYVIVTKGHGGSIAVDSSTGRGTMFTIELPLDAHGGERS